MRDFVELNELYPLIKEVLDSGGTFRFYPRGTSMEPLLHAGRDSIVLDKVGDIAAGDVLFYRRKNGQFVLHRLIEIRGGTYTMCGDNQLGLEYGIKREQILAKMVGYYTGEEYHSVDEAEYLGYTKKMISRFPFSRRNPTLYKTLRKIKHIFKKPS